MSLFIKPYLSGLVAKIPTKEESPAYNNNEGTSANPSTHKTQTLSISVAAQARYFQSAAIERQTAMSKSQLQGLHENQTRTS